MQLVRRFQPALFCAFAVLACELISHPYVTMGVCDDGLYILMVRTLAATGHVVYNGWAAPMLTGQLYLAAAMVKLFGFSSTTIRVSTLLVSMALAFLLQRILVRTNITERNATIGTLAFVLSPIYLLMSFTFMTDIFGLFAIVVCIYGCLRALQASTSRAAIVWLCFAVAANAICGTSRQIAWLGILVMVPSTLWLLSAQRRVLIGGTAATLAGCIFIFACLQWLKHQPYMVPEHLLPNTFPLAHTLEQLVKTFLDVPFLLLPIVILFIPEIRKNHPRVNAAIVAVSLVYARLAIHRAYLPLLEPTQHDWVTVYGIFNGFVLKGTPPIFLNIRVQVLLTIACFGGILGLVASLRHLRRTPPASGSLTGTSWRQLGILLAPFIIVYSLLLVPRATTTDGIYDRYLLPLLVVALICLVRYYQDRIQPRIPLASVLLVAMTAIYGITVTHNTFSLYRARVRIASEIRAAGVPDTSVDNGWEYNLGVELQTADHINNPVVLIPAHAYAPTPPPPAGACDMFWYDETPHMHPLYGVSFDPNACYGSAPFAPVHYSRWLAFAPGTLYVVRYIAPTRP